MEERERIGVRDKVEERIGNGSGERAGEKAGEGAARPTETSKHYSKFGIISSFSPTRRNEVLNQL